MKPGGARRIPACGDRGHRHPRHPRIREDPDDRRRRAATPVRRLRGAVSWLKARLAATESASAAGIANRAGARTRRCRTPEVISHAHGGWCRGSGGREASVPAHRAQKQQRSISQHVERERRAPVVRPASVREHGDTQCDRDGRERHGLEDISVPTRGLDRVPVCHGPWIAVTSATVPRMHAAASRTADALRNPPLDGRRCTAAAIPIAVSNHDGEAGKILRFVQC